MLALGMPHEPPWICVSSSDQRSRVGRSFEAPSSSPSPSPSPMPSASAAGVAAPVKGPPPPVPVSTRPHPPIVGPSTTQRRLPKTASESDASASTDEATDSEFSNVRLRNMNGSSSPPEMVKSLFDYEACHDDELTLHRGSLIQVISKDSKASGDDGWWVGDIEGKVGVFPANFVNSDVEAALQNLPTTAQPKLIPLSELTLAETIGHGGFCTVYRAIYANKDAAVKVLFMETKKEQETREAVKTEGRLFHMLLHENIVTLYGVCLEKPALVMEFCAGGPLTKVYSEAQETSANIVVDWAIQIAKGMLYLHEQAPISLVHRDLKGCNVLVKQRVCHCSTAARTPLTPPGGLFPQFPTRTRQPSDTPCSRCHGAPLDQLTLKITDFGLARETSARMSMAGTYAWMAPEVIKNQTCSKASDVWSYGVLLWELLTRQTPYKGFDHMTVAYKVAMNTVRLPIPKECPDDLRLIMETCWKVEPHLRPTFSTLLEKLTVFREEMTASGKLQEESALLRMQDEMTVEIEEFFKELKAKENELHLRDQRLKEQSRLLHEREMEVFQRELFMTIRMNGTPPKPHKRRGRLRLPKWFGRERERELISTPKDFVHKVAVRSTLRPSSCSPPGSPTAIRNLRIYQLPDAQNPSMNGDYEEIKPNQNQVQSSIFGTLPRTRNQLTIANGGITIAGGNGRVSPRGEIRVPAGGEPMKYRSTPNLNAIKTGSSMISVNLIDAPINTSRGEVNHISRDVSRDRLQASLGLERKNAWRRKKESSGEHTPEDMPTSFDAVDVATDLDYRENALDVLATPRRRGEPFKDPMDNSLHPHFERPSSSRKSLSAVPTKASFLSKLLLNAGSMFAAPAGYDLRSAEAVEAAQPSSSVLSPSPSNHSQPLPPPPPRLVTFQPTRGPGGLAFLHHDSARRSDRSASSRTSFNTLTPDDDQSLRYQKSPTSPTDHSFPNNTINKRLPQPTANTRSYCRTTPMQERRGSQQPPTVRQSSVQTIADPSNSSNSSSQPCPIHHRTHSCDDAVRNGVAHLPPSSHHHHVPAIPSSHHRPYSHNRPITQPQLSTVIPIGGSAVAPTSQPQPFSVWNPGYEQCRLPSPSTITTRPERPITLDLHPSASTPLTPAESGISTAGSSYVSLPSADRLPTLLDSAPPAAVPIYERIQRTPPLVPPRSRRPTTEDGDLPRLSPVQHSPPYDHL